MTDLLARTSSEEPAPIDMIPVIFQYDVIGSDFSVYITNELPVAGIQGKVVCDIAGNGTQVPISLPVSLPAARAGCNVCMCAYIIQSTLVQERLRTSPPSVQTQALHWAT